MVRRSGSEERPTDILSSKDAELVAIGAAIASNCVPCIKHHIPAAREAGLSDLAIREAIKLADTVRRVPARKILQSAHELLGEAPVGSSRGEAASPCAPAETNPSTAKAPAGQKCS